MISVDLIRLIMTVLGVSVVGIICPTEYQVKDMNF